MKPDKNSIPNCIVIGTLIYDLLNSAKFVKFERHAKFLSNINLDPFTLPGTYSWLKYTTNHRSTLAKYMQQ